jgi:hypothetical protein
MAARSISHQRARAAGFSTFGEYSERVLGHGRRTTEEKLRVAEALERLPQLEQALKENLLSFSAVRELTRVATDASEADWITAARSKSVREIEQLVRGRKTGDLPSDPAKPELVRHTLRAELSAETMATLNEALAKLRRDAGGPLDMDAAFMLMARQVLGGPRDDGRASYQISVTVCEQCRQATQEGKGEQLHVAPEVREMAECDAKKLAPPGTRASQTIPPAVRRFVLRRHSGCCAVPGCRASVFVDVHHVDPRNEGGTHDPERLVVLCAAHHRAVHRGTLTITGTASAGFVFQHADGSAYGRVQSPARATDATRVFQALRQMGCKESDARRALDAARAHVGADSNVESLLREALKQLSERALRCRDSARPTYRARGGFAELASIRSGGPGAIRFRARSFSPP